MSLAIVLAYGDGFQTGQNDMAKRVLDLWEAQRQIEEAETEGEKLKVEAFWNGYVDGANAYNDGVRL